MTSSPKEANKLVGDVVDTLTVLERAITSSSNADFDYLPSETTMKAYNALRALDQVLLAGKEGARELKGRGSVLNVMDKIGPKLDDPSIQTMLGTMAVEFSGIFHTVHNSLTQKDPKKVEGTLFGQLDKE